MVALWPCLWWCVVLCSLRLLRTGVASRSSAVLPPPVRSGCICACSLDDGPILSIRCNGALPSIGQLVHPAGLPRAFCGPLCCRQQWPGSGQRCLLRRLAEIWLHMAGIPPPKCLRAHTRAPPAGNQIELTPSIFIGCWRADPCDGAGRSDETRRKHCIGRLWSHRRPSALFQLAH